MRWSLQLGRVRGIKIQVHWTFLILIVWIVMMHASQGANALEVAEGVALVLAVFGCVVLHELGHALTAQRYEIQTKDITLLPIGGVARLERLPEKPIEEFWVAVAGPAVNVVIAVVLGVGLAVFGSIEPMRAALDVRAGFIGQLMWINVLLVLFNLLPAFPMDGGRILRSLLATRIDYARATAIAASVGQMMAIAFGLVGLFTNPFLVFIAIFVYLGAQAEAEHAQTQSALSGVLVRDAMLTEFHVLSSGQSLGHAAHELLAGSQQDFPVIDEDRLIGMLFRPALVAALKKRGSDTPISTVVRTDCLTVHPDEALAVALTRLRTAGCASVPVLEAGRLVGLLTLENVGELMMVQSALSRRDERGALAEIFATD